MVAPSKRGGVPVLSRPTSNPRSRIQSERCSADDSPARPAGKRLKPTWISPLRNVPDVRITAFACMRSPRSVTTPATAPARVSNRSTVPSPIVSPGCESNVRFMAFRYSFLSHWTRRARTAGPLLVLMKRNWMPA